MVNNILLSAVSAGGIPNWFAVIMGIGTVFVGLLSIIIICVITGAVCGGNKKISQSGSPAPKVDNSYKAPNRQEIIAAVCAAAAEDMGTDINALRVVSFKKL